jgi:hypothetical protein
VLDLAEKEAREDAAKIEAVLRWLETKLPIDQDLTDETIFHKLPERDSFLKVLERSVEFARMVKLLR